MEAAAAEDTPDEGVETTVASDDSATEAETTPATGGSEPEA